MRKEVGGIYVGISKCCLYFFIEVTKDTVFPLSCADASPYSTKKPLGILCLKLLLILINFH
jgi:hypothetical protein